MRNLKTYKYYLIFFVVILISWFVFKTNENTFVFNIVGDYYVTYYSDLLEITIIPIFSIGLIYWLFSLRNLPLIKILNKIHTATTIIGLSILLIIVMFSEYISPSDTVSKFPLFDESVNIPTIIYILLFLILLAQITFVLNIVISILKYSFNIKNN